MKEKSKEVFICPTCQAQVNKVYKNNHCRNCQKIRRKARLLSEQEKDLIFATCDNLLDRLFIRLLKNVGSRRITVASMRIEEFNFTSKIYHKEHQEKTFKSITMPLDEALLSDLKIYINSVLKGQKQGWLFPSYGKTGHIRDKTIYNHVKKLTEKGKLQDILPHDFRKTFMKTAGLKGLPSNMVSQAMGVDPKTMIKHYEEYSPEELHEQFKKIQT